LSAAVRIEPGLSFSLQDSAVTTPAPEPVRTVAVLGAGISGLAAAHRARELDPTVTVHLYDRADRTGGVIRTLEQEGFLIEAGPDSILSNRPAGMNLIERLGIQDQLLQTSEKHRRALVYHRKKLYPLPEGFMLLAPTRVWPFAWSGLFSVGGKMRMLWERFVKPGGVDGDESVEAFVSRRFGRESVERIAQPLIGGIYGARLHTLSLQATMPQLPALVNKYGSVIRGMLKSGQGAAKGGGARYSMFVTFREGMETLTRTLTERLPTDALRLNTDVTRVSKKDGRWFVETSRGDSTAYDAVVLALKAPIAANLVREADAALAASLDGVPYLSSFVAHLAVPRDAVRHKLDGFGFLIPDAADRSFFASSFSSVKFEGRAPEGKVLLRAFGGGDLQKGLMDRSDDALLDGVQHELFEILGVTGEPLFRMIHRYEETLPLLSVGHLDRMKTIQEQCRAHSGLAYAGNASKRPGVPDCIASGEAAVERLLATPG
jgi:oxygen-dependent protoporphyrinogen oxidase